MDHESERNMKVRGSFLSVGSNQGIAWERRKNSVEGKKRKERRKKKKGNEKKKRKEKKKRRKKRKERKTKERREKNTWMGKKEKRGKKGKWLRFPVFQQSEVDRSRIKVGLLAAGYE